MALNIINFSNGIRPEEIQDNFEYLQEQLSRERVSVGGAGISAGLDITVNVTNDVFNITVSSGSIIDEEGQEVFIESKTIEINPPILYQSKEYVVLSEEKTIELKHVPYSLDRRAPVEYTGAFEPENSGITVHYRNSVNSDDFIRVRDIKNRTAIIAGAVSRELEVQYNYTAKRIDALYLDENLEIKIKEGTTSTTPSAILPTDAKYLIAYLEIDHEYKTDTDVYPHAYIYVKNDLRTIRNLYTDKDGQLYVCGIPFDELQIIHLQEPINPKEYSLWLNLTDNTLYCWRAVDEYVYKNKIDVSTDFINNTNAEYVFSTYMDFTLGGEELKVFLNGAQLVWGRDYEEISHDLATYAGNVGDSDRGNSFRILQTMIRPDGFEEVLIPGDVITYTISYLDSQYMWVPINKMNFVNVKATKVYSTWYEEMDPKYLYDNDKAYFDSDTANRFGLDTVNNYPYKYQYFLFDRIEDLDMHFTPGRKEMSIMVNQMQLHEDQFKEITVYDLQRKGLLDLPDEVIAAAPAFGWTNDVLDNSFNGDYDRAGIGFMLINPLDAGAREDEGNWRENDGSNDLFVEVSVEHRVCSNPLNRKLERSATFVHEDSFVADDSFDGKVQMAAKYRYAEHQLEVFIDGIKQVVGVDYIEEHGYYKEIPKSLEDENVIEDIKIPPMDMHLEEYTDVYKEDQSYFMNKKSAVCTRFQFLKDSLSGSTISYRITTNIYSYDHINSMLDNMGDTLESCKVLVDEYTDEMNSFKEEIITRVEIAEEKVAEYVSKDEDYLTVDSIISLSQMPEVAVANMIKSLSHINVAIMLKKDQMIYSLNGINGIEDIWEKDYINIFYHNTANNYDNYWVRDHHYSIKEMSSDGGLLSYLEIADNVPFAEGDMLYISGLKLSNNRPIM